MRVLDKLDRSRLFVFVAALLLALPFFPTKKAYGSVSIVHSFFDGSVANDGAYSYAQLILGPDGNFYGTAYYNGSTGRGTVFKMTPTGVVTILHSFNDGSVANDGQNPYAKLTLGSDGNFYGTTERGGSTGRGTVFKMTPAGVVTILHSFNDGSVAYDGQYPDIGVTEGPDGNFYGTIYPGGSAGAGIAYKITSDGTYTLLRTFMDNSVANDVGVVMSGFTLGADGYLYGAAAAGITGYGGVFKMTPDGVITIVHTSNGSEGAGTKASLTLASDGNFYGTAAFGGIGGGTVFKVTPAGTYTTLHSFNTYAQDGANSCGAIIEGSDGNFYGTTQNGGSTTTDPFTTSKAGYGTVFKITPDGTYTILHSFGDGSTANDGKHPFAGLAEGFDGNLYGTTETGGSTDSGTVFRVDNATLVTFNVSCSGTPVVNSPISFTVTARDSDGNTLSRYHGNVHFTSSDPQAILPADTTLTNGTGSFSATFNTGGNQTITATDAIRPNDTGTSNSIAVMPKADHFVVSAPGTVTSGTGFSVTVTAKNQFNNVATGYTGTVHFTSTDPGAIFPVDVTLTNGTGTFTATLAKAGTQTITATDIADSSITGTSGNIVINPGAAERFAVTTDTNPATAGASFHITAIAHDHYNNIATGYSGTVHFSTILTGNTLPVNTTLTNGGGTFSATLFRSTPQVITATDTINSSITGSTGNIAVKAAAVDHFVVTAPGTATAGSVSAVSVTAKDAYNNTVATYSGTVHFSSTDARSTLPADATLTNGAGTFSATLKTAGIQTVTATDTVNSNITGSTGNIVVSPSAVDHFTVVAPGTATAGTVFTVSVTAKDVYANTVTGYTGTVHFTSTDPNATLPADATLTNGAGTFNATLITSGIQMISATDTNTSSIMGTSGNIAVSSAGIVRFSVSAPGTVIAGTPFNVTISARDQYNNIVAGYSGMLFLTTSAASNSLPSGSMLLNGSGTFSVTMNTTGSQLIAVFDAATFSIFGVSSNILVQPGPTTHFAITAPATVAAGVSNDYVVTALDSQNNLTPGYAGTVHFTSTDPQSILPADTAVTGGTGTASITFVTASSETLRVRDTVNTALTGTVTVSVIAGTATHLTITAPTAATVGMAFNAVVTAKDAYNNTVAGYYGTIHITSTDTSAVLPANFTLTSGAKQISIKLQTPGTQTVTATDTTNSSLTATTGNINVTTTASKLVITASTATTAGNSLTFTVTAKDVVGNTVPDYSGTVHFTSTDAQAVLPADSTLTNGVGTFTVTFKTAATQSITAADTATATIKGGISGIVVSAGAASQFVIAAPTSVTSGTAFYATVTAKDAYGNLAKSYAGTVHFTSSDSAAVLPADLTLVSGTRQISLKLKTRPSQTFSATDTVNTGITATSGQVSVN